MSKWHVYGAVTGTKYLGTVEADTQEEAESIVESLSYHVSLCNKCSHEISDPEIGDITVEPDGE